MRPAGSYKKMNRSTEDDFFFCSSSIFSANTRHAVENRLCEDIKTSFALHDVERSEDLFFFFFRAVIYLDDENCGPFKSSRSSRRRKK